MPVKFRRSSLKSRKSRNSRNYRKSRKSFRRPRRGRRTVRRNRKNRMSRGKVKRGIRRKFMGGAQLKPDDQQKPWIWQTINREGAEVVLQNATLGTYLVRTSKSVDAPWALSIKNPDKIVHNKIYEKDGGYVLNVNEIKSDSITDLIKKHKGGETDALVDPNHTPVTEQIIVLDRSNGQKLGFTLKGGSDGAVITTVEPGGQAEKKGLEADMVITHINGHDVKNKSTKAVGIVVEQGNTTTLKIAA